MMTNSTSARLRIGDIPGNVLTHGGKFHADDVFSGAFLTILKPGIQIERAFQVPEGYAGLVFDLGWGRFDHHQQGAPVRENGVPYAAFGPVSYTHLDVYKRQGYGLGFIYLYAQLAAGLSQAVIHLGGALCFPYGIRHHLSRLPQGIQVVSVNIHGHIPVSYTHLDVYKRQVQGNMSTGWIFLTRYPFRVR